MDSPEPANTYLVGGAALPVRAAPASFPYSEARRFQAEGVKWISDGDEPVGLLAAPTGGGKTAVIASLAEASDRILCLYPTNALTEAQADTLREDYNLTVDVLTGRTLTARGHERAKEVMSYARDPAGGDVVITNPDVLQAILGKQYLSPGSELLRFFAHFDGAVYDEFHYYNPLAASGMLLQIKVLSERGRYQGREGDLQFPRIMLPSATPAQAFINHVEEDLDLSVSRIQSTLLPLDVGDGGPAPTVPLAYDHGEVDEGVLTDPNEVRHPESANDVAAAQEATGAVPREADRFRYPMVVNRWDIDIEDAFEEITEALHTGIGLDEADEPTGRAAVIFNSAARSNWFHQYLLRETDLGPVAVKDNGYDTGSDRPRPDDFAILNTTSKGEVGLDFDLERLVMVTPFTASDFVQRIGRSARHSPAVVDVFGLDDPLWPAVQSYPVFLGRVVEALGDPSMRRDRLRDLLGVRAARALQQRTADSEYHTADMYEDFGDVPHRRRWSRFLEACDDAQDATEPTENPFAPRPDRATKRLLAGIEGALAGLDSLRGRSVEGQLRYPFGAGTDRTDYDLVTALRHYRIARIQGDVIVLDEGEPSSRIGHYRGKPKEGRGVDLVHSNAAIDRTLRSGFESYLNNASLTVTDLKRDDLRRFLQIINLSSAMLPERIEADGIVFHCNEKGEVERIVEKDES